MIINIAKLKSRYPDGFSIENSIARNDKKEVSAQIEH